MLANTIVAVTADHGEGLGEHGEDGHAYLIYDAVLHVPLIVAGPGLPAGRRVPLVVPNAGIAATLLALAGAPPLHRPDVGDLAPLWRDGPAASASGEAYAESVAGELDFGWAPLHSLRTDRYHYIRAPRPELYDLAADPHELRNLLPSHETGLVETVKANESRIDALLASDAGLHPRSVDAETRERVEALGYVVPDGSAVKTGADPKDVHQLADLAWDVLALAFEKKSDEAERLALEGLRRMPESSRLHDVLARIYLDTRRPALALPHAQAAARIAPGVADFHAQVGDVYLALGDVPKAVEAYEQALDAAPEHAGSHIGAMWRVKLGGSIEDAEAHARQALEYCGRRAEIAERIGEVWESLGEYERALAVFERGVQEFPEHEPFHMRLAIQYARLGEQARAERELAEAGKAAADVYLRNRLGVVYAARRDFAQAERIFRGILVERPDESAARHYLSRTLRSMGRETEAAQLLEGVAPDAASLPQSPTEAQPRG